MTYAARIVHIHPGKHVANRFEVTFLACGTEWDGYLWAPVGHYKGRWVASFLTRAQVSQELVLLTTLDSNYGGVQILNAEPIEVPA